MSECVYSIVNAAGHRKIGMSSKPERRLSDLQIANSDDLRFELMLPCERSFDIETKMHELFSHRRVRGEWFDVTFDEVWHAMDLAHYAVHGWLANPYQWIDPFTWPLARHPTAEDREASREQAA